MRKKLPPKPNWIARERTVLHPFVQGCTHTHTLTIHFNAFKQGHGRMQKSRGPEFIDKGQRVPFSLSNLWAWVPQCLKGWISIIQMLYLQYIVLSFPFCSCIIRWTELPGRRQIVPTHLFQLCISVWCYPVWKWGKFASSGRQLSASDEKVLLKNDLI